MQFILLHYTLKKKKKTFFKLTSFLFHFFICVVFLFFLSLLGVYIVQTFYLTI